MTNRLIYGEDERLVRWAEERIPHQQFREDAKAIGHERGGQLVAVCVFDTFSPNSCCVGLAADTSGRLPSWRWSSREFAIACMAYPFLQCGFNHITCIVSALNERSLRYTRKFGWVQEGILREAGPEGEDMILFGMLRRECRWLPPLAGAGISGAATV